MKPAAQGGLRKLTQAAMGLCCCAAAMTASAGGAFSMRQCGPDAQHGFADYLAAANKPSGDVVRYYSRAFLAYEVNSVLTADTDADRADRARLMKSRFTTGRGERLVDESASCTERKCVVTATLRRANGSSYRVSFTYAAERDDCRTLRIDRIEFHEHLD